MLVAGSLLLVLAPLLAVLALAVALESGRPVLFRQVRVGQGGRPFTMLKFRTMRPSCGGRSPEVTVAADPRVTRLGALLRRASLDELPQLVHVLSGRMTLVGPRPETVGLAARYPAELCWVFDHRPGLTGPAQVRWRNASVEGAGDVEAWYLERLVPERVALDAEYLVRPSLAATFGVVAATLRHLVTSGPRGT